MRFLLLLIALSHCIFTYAQINDSCSYAKLMGREYTYEVQEDGTITRKPFECKPIDIIKDLDKYTLYLVLDYNNLDHIPIGYSVLNNNEQIKFYIPGGDLSLFHRNNTFFNTNYIKKIINSDLENKNFKIIDYFKDYNGLIKTKEDLKVDNVVYINSENYQKIYEYIKGNFLVYVNVQNPNLNLQENEYFFIGFNKL